jgi:hypothetical protein
VFRLKPGAGMQRWKARVPVFSCMWLLPVWHVEPFAFLFQNLRHRAAFHAPLICNVLLPNTRVLLVVETNFLTLVIEEPLFARFADELLESLSCRVFKEWPIEFGPYAGPLRQARNGRGDAVCGRVGARTEGRTGEQWEWVLGRNRRGGV